MSGTVFYQVSLYVYLLFEEKPILPPLSYLWVFSQDVHLQLYLFTQQPQFNNSDYGGGILTFMTKKDR